MPRHLLLIRHAQTEPTPGLRPAEFQLSDSGRRSCVPFARALARWDPAAIVTSEEDKARETGEIIGRELGLRVESIPGLEEHHRGVVAQLASPAGFRAAVERIFDEPDRVAYGEESGAAALERFSNAIEHALAQYPEGNLAVVTHGTVLALFVAAHNFVEAKPLWRKLQMPDLVVLKLPGFKQVEVAP